MTAQTRHASRLQAQQNHRSGQGWRGKKLRSDLESSREGESEREDQDAFIVRVYFALRTLHPIAAPPCFTASIASVPICESRSGVVSNSARVLWSDLSFQEVGGLRLHSTWWSLPCGLQVRTSWSYWLRNMRRARLFGRGEGKPTETVAVRCVSREWGGRRNCNKSNRYYYKHRL